MNIELLNRIKAAILAEPKRFDMSYWHIDRHGQDIKTDGTEDESDPVIASQFQTIFDCGTTHCIGGWAQVLTSKRGFCEEAAISVLDITVEQAKRLFYAHNWTYQFQTPYYDAMAEYRHDQAAQITADRIDHFIKTNGAE